MRTRACEKRESGKQPLGLCLKDSMYIPDASCFFFKLNLKYHLLLNIL